MLEKNYKIYDVCGMYVLVFIMSCLLMKYIYVLYLYNVFINIIFRC